ncbi:MAG: glycosyltransferase [Clostridia bacterium]|nr:glycosyltransferase [Clostridia bacterium]
MGNIGNAAYSYAKFLNRIEGVRAELLLSESESSIDSHSNPAWEDTANCEMMPEWVKYYPGKDVSKKSFIHKLLLQIKRLFHMTRLFRNYDIIMGFSLTAIYPMLLFKKYISLTTGADITEVSYENTILGFLYRRALKNAKRVFILNINQAKEAQHLKLRNSEYLPFAIDTRKYSLENSESICKKDNEKISLIHTCRLDWTEKHRNSIKNNDIFFRGLAKFIQHNKEFAQNRLDIKVFEFGKDILATKKLIKELGIEEYIDFVPLCRKEELIKYYKKSDIVIDQFYLGGFGLNFLEALSCECVVFCYLEEMYLNLFYPEGPSFCNCANEENVYENLNKVLLYEDINLLKKSAREWVIDYHDGDKVAQKLHYYIKTII